MSSSFGGPNLVSGPGRFCRGRKRRRNGEEYGKSYLIESQSEELQNNSADKPGSSLKKDWPVFSRYTGVRNCRALPDSDIDAGNIVIGVQFLMASWRIRL